MLLGVVLLCVSRSTNSSTYSTDRLLTAARLGNFETVSRLIAMGSNVNKRDGRI